MPDGGFYRALRLRPGRGVRMEQTLNIQIPFPIRSLAVNELNLKIIHTQKGYGVLVPGFPGMDRVGQLRGTAAIMLKSLVVLTIVGVLGATAPVALADPLGGEPLPDRIAADSAPAPAADNGAVASAEPGTLRTREGWVLAIAAKDEAQLPVAPLTTALSSREYVVSGTFLGAIQGSGTTKLTDGILEAGYQIGCGVSAAEVDLRFGGGITPQISPAGVPSIGGNVFGQVRPTLKPGTATIIPVTKMAFEGDSARVTITAFRIKIDSCVGQSFIRSYAILTSSTEDTQDVVTYMGVTKAV